MYMLLESLLFWKQILNCVFSTSVFSILIVFELPSLAMYMLRESVILEADFKLRVQYF